MKVKNKKNCVSFFFINNFNNQKSLKCEQSKNIFVNF